MTKDEEGAIALKIAMLVHNMSPLDRMVTFVTLASDKNLKAQFVQDYIQKYGPIPDEYADKVKNAMEV